MNPEFNARRAAQIAVFFAAKEGGHYDKACVLAKGEHPFMKRDSYVVYSKALSRSTKQIVECLENGSFVPKEPVPRETMDRISAGFDISDFVQRWVFDCLDAAKKHNG